MDGYIKLHRKVVDSVIFEREKLFKVFVWCLMRANYKERKVLFGGQEITLKAGQFITGRDAGSQSCKMKKSTFWDQILLLKKLGKVDIKSDNKKTLITVIKWDKYQVDESSTDSSTDNKPTTNRQQTDTDKKERKKENREIYKEARPRIPNLDEILSYSKEMNFDQNLAREFFFFYDSQEWKTSGENSRPITNWISKLNEWVLRKEKETIENEIKRDSIYKRGNPAGVYTQPKIERGRVERTAKNSKFNYNELDQERAGIIQG